MTSIITNGDLAADALRTAYPGLPVLPWRDSLVDGPVQALPEEAFCDARARHLAYAFGHDYGKVRAIFAARQQTFGGMAGGSDGIDLWFETDLYDQLQVLEILACLAGQTAHPPVRLTQVPPPLPQHDIAALASRAAEVTPDEFAAAAAMWDAVTAPTPEAMAREALRDGPLPIARAALRRFLQELPAPGDGLSRIERETLRAITAGADTSAAAFRACTASEDPPFLGDAGFFLRLIDLSLTFGLIHGLSQRVVWDPAAQRCDNAFFGASIALTERGRAVLAGQHDLAVDPRIDRWVGGTHLTPGAIWRWDEARAALIPPGST